MNFGDKLGLVFSQNVQDIWLHVSRSCQTFYILFGQHYVNTVANIITDV